MRPLKQRFLEKISVSENTDCWIWTGSKRRGGYGQFLVCRKPRSAHRVSYELHYGAFPNGLHVCHRCDNRACVNPEHLFLGTNAENMADMVAKGRQARGDKVSKKGIAHHSAKLTEAEVVAIRASDDVSGAKLARKYGVNRSQIYSIRSGKTWSHLTQQDGD